MRHKQNSRNISDDYNALDNKRITNSSQEHRCLNNSLLKKTKRRNGYVCLPKDKKRTLKLLCYV